MELFIQQMTGRNAVSSLFVNEVRNRRVDSVHSLAALRTVKRYKPSGQMSPVIGDTLVNFSENGIGRRETGCRSAKIGVADE